MRASISWSPDARAASTAASSKRCRLNVSELSASIRFHCAWPPCGMLRHQARKQQERGRSGRVRARHGSTRERVLARAPLALDAQDHARGPAWAAARHKRARGRLWSVAKRAHAERGAPAGRDRARLCPRACQTARAAARHRALCRITGPPFGRCLSQRLQGPAQRAAGAAAQSAGPVARAPPRPSGSASAGARGRRCLAPPGAKLGRPWTAVQMQSSAVLGVSPSGRFVDAVRA